MIAHNGGNGIFSADFRRYTDAGLVVFVASNVSEWKAFEVSPKLARAVFGMKVALPPKVAAIDETRLAAFAGTYALPSGARITIAVRGARLAASAEGQEAFSLLAAGTGADPSRAEELNRRTAAILEASRAGWPESGACRRCPRSSSCRNQRPSSSPTTWPRKPS